MGINLFWIESFENQFQICWIENFEFQIYWIENFEKYDFPKFKIDLKTILTQPNLDYENPTLN